MTTTFQHSPADHVIPPFIPEQPNVSSAPRPRAIEDFPLAATATAVNCAMMYVDYTLRRWDMMDLLHPVDLVVAELVDDAVKLTGVPDPSSRLHLRGPVDRRRSGDQRTFAAQLRSNGVAHGGGCRCPALRTFGHSDVSLRSDHRDGRARPGTRTETRCPWAGSPTACTSRSSAAGAR